MIIKHKPYLPLRITSKYGKRNLSGLPAGATAWHDGIDIGRDYKYGGPYSNDPCGPVYAVLDGTVVDSKFYSGRGNTIKIDHGTINGKKVMTLYQHLHKDGLATIGQKIEAGDIIAQMGRTGMGSDMMVHLHYELHINGQTVDPLPYLTGEKEVAYVPKEIKININNKIVTAQAINKDGNNYVRLQDLRSEKIEIGYQDKMPTIKTK